MRAKNADLADRVEQSYQACLQTIEPFVTEGQAATVPYSSLGISQRGKIVKASYVFRDALIQAREALGVGEA